MYDDGYQYITNIDLSPTVVKSMQDIYAEKCPHITYKHMDMKALNYDNGHFDAVIDKAAIDSVFCGDGAAAGVEQSINEIHRVLSPNGVFISVTYGPEEKRAHFYNKADYNWNVTVKGISKPTIPPSQTTIINEYKEDKGFHWVYICEKKGK